MEKKKSQYTGFEVGSLKIGMTNWGRKKNKRKSKLVQSQAACRQCCVALFYAVGTRLCPAFRHSVQHVLGWQSHTGQGWSERQLGRIKEDITQDQNCTYLSLNTAKSNFLKSKTLSVLDDARSEKSFWPVYWESNPLGKEKLWEASLATYWKDPSTQWTPFPHVAKGISPWLLWNCILPVCPSLCWGLVEIYCPNIHSSKQLTSAN